MTRLGIYGYEFSRVVELNDHRLIPITESPLDACNLASDLNKYNLTGFLELNDEHISDVNAYVFDLSGVLSFIDQKSVVIKNKLKDSETYRSLEKDYPTSLKCDYRNDGGGEVIIKDSISANSRELFIKKAMAALDSASTTSSLRIAFFKSIEIFRSNANYIDVTYYLMFSGLEALCREIQNDYSSSCAVPIARVLNNYEFDIAQDNIRELAKAVSTYAHLRNSLFHNGKYEKEINTNGETVMLYLADYETQFSRLVKLVLIKHIGFDDGYINWNSWLDRMHFKTCAQ